MSFLTQQEIDALVQGVDPGAGTAPEEALPFNFRRPPRIARERQMVLEGIHARYAAALQGFLSTRLRQPADVSLSSVELISFAEFRLSLGDPCSTWFFGMGDAAGHQAIMDLDARLATHLVDRLFGGPGEDGTVIRTPTPLEIGVMHGLADRLLALWREAWSDHLPLTPALGAFETTAENLRLVGPEENVLVANLAVRSGVGGGVIAIALPYTAVETFLQERAGPVVRAVRGRADDRAMMRQTVEQHLRAVPVPVAARLPEFRLSAFDIASLQVGQVIETGQPRQGLVDLHINGRLLFVGTLGRHNGAVGLRVTDRADRHATPRPQRRKVIS